MSLYIRYPASSAEIPTYANYSSLPTLALDGSLAVTLDTYSIYVFELGSLTWVLESTAGSTVTSIGTFGSTPNNAGGSISGNVLTLQPADGTHPGGVSTTTQTFAGNKTFSGSITANTFIALNPTTAPGSPTAGDFYYDSSLGTFRHYTTAWYSFPQDAKTIVATDYSGSDLGAQINSADTALGSTPGVILVPSGNYTITTQIVLTNAKRILRFGSGVYTLNVSSTNGSNALIINNDFITVEGNGMYETTLIQASGLTNGDDVIRAVGHGSTSYKNYTSGTVTTVTGARVRNMTVDGNRANVTPHANDTYGNGINLNYTIECIVENVLVQNAEAHGIVYFGGTTSSKRNIIRNNYVTACGEAGIGFEGYQSEGLVINNNIHDLTVSATFPNSCTGMIIGAIGLAQNAQEANLISSNVLRNIPGNGIDLQDGNQYTVISSNILDNVGTTAGHGINTDYQSSGFYPNKTLICNNYILNQADANSRAIQIQGLTTSYGYFQVTGNKIDNCQGGGILIGTTLSCEATNNYINAAGLGAGSLDNGISISGNNAYVAGNYIIGCTGYGINVISGASAIVIGQNYLSGNTAGQITDAGTGTVYLGSYDGTSTKTSTVLNLTNSTASSSSSTGALVVTGGVGIGGALNLGTALSIGNGGTGQTSASAAFNALSPMTTLGDIIYGGASGAGTRLAGNTTSTKQYLSQIGTGSVSAAPSWSAISAGDLPTITLTSDVTGSGSGGSVATTVSKIQGTTVSGTTGSTNVVFSASPTLTGTLTAAAATFSSTVTEANNVAMQWNDSGSTARRIALVSSSNNLYFGSIDTGWGGTSQLNLLAPGSINFYVNSGSSQLLGANLSTAGSLYLAAQLAVNNTSLDSTALASIAGTSPISGTTVRGLNITYTGATANTSLEQGVRVALTGSTANLTNYVGYVGSAFTAGSGQTITRATDYYAGGAASHIATNNAAFSDDSTTYTGNYFIYQGGTDGSRLGGALTLAASGTALTVTNTASIGTLSLTNALSIANGGTGQTSASAAFNALSPMTTLGDIIYGGSSGAGTRLAGSTSSTKQFLTQTGNGSVSAAPAWGTIAAGDLPTITLTGDVTGSASGGSVATTLAATSNGTLATLSKSTGVAVHGTTTNDNASSGYVGEFVSANPGSSVGVTTSGNYITITSISLTAGDWDVEGVCELSDSGTTAATQISGAISTSNNALDSAASGGTFSYAYTLGTSATTRYPTGARRISISSTTTIYLVGLLVYSVLGGSIWNTNSFIRARRVR